MNSKLYVGNLSWSVTEDQLRQHFGQIGMVRMATIILNRDTGRSRGFGFVEMERPAAAPEAIRVLNDTYLGDRKIIVKEAMPEGQGTGNNGSIFGQIGRFFEEAREDQEFEFMVGGRFFVLTRKGNRDGSPARQSY